MITETGHGANFINMLTYSFYTRRYWKHKKLLDMAVFFALLESARVKATCKIVVKLTHGNSAKRGESKSTVWSEETSPTVATMRKSSGNLETHVSNEIRKYNNVYKLTTKKNKQRFQCFCIITVCWNEKVRILGFHDMASG